MLSNVPSVGSLELHVMERIKTGVLEILTIYFGKKYKIEFTYIPRTSLPAGNNKSMCLLTDMS